MEARSPPSLTSALLQMADALGRPLGPVGGGVIQGLRAGRVPGVEDDHHRRVPNRMNTVMELTCLVWSGSYHGAGGGYGAEERDGYYGYADAIPLLFTRGLGGQRPGR
ncbi:hypothetical protein ACFVYV_42400 [Streptomyces mirabilis]|uniref:hypothetical protein n=1 Tax=Streptomyces mirabilis TaxID=68239 RepID=UPI0036DC20DB